MVNEAVNRHLVIVQQIRTEGHKKTFHFESEKRDAFIDGIGIALMHLHVTHTSFQLRLEVRCAFLEKLEEEKLPVSPAPLAMFRKDITDAVMKRMWTGA
jgi:hypothetical protein